jgi:hypothetical protein
MTDTFYMTFRTTEFKMEDSIIKKMASYFGQRGIYHEGDINKDAFFRTTYQDNKFEIFVEVYEKIGTVLKVVTTHKSNYNSIISGFVVVIRDMLTNYFKVKYYDIEVIVEENLHLISKTFEPRFITRKSMCLYLDDKNSDILPLNIETIDKSQIVIKRGAINNKLFNLDEQAWHTIGTKLDYDDWDMTSAEFVPLTFDEFENEITEFVKYWNISISDYEISSQSEINSILRINRNWDGNLYLIKTKNQMEFIWTNVWTG